MFVNLLEMENTKVAVEKKVRGKIIHTAGHFAG
jgi:hypothetical protein